MRVKYKNYVTVDTESNPDGSLYLISLCDMATMETELFYDLETFYVFISKLSPVKAYIHNFGDWDSFFLLHDEIIKDYKQTKTISKNKSILSITLKHKLRDVVLTFEDTLPRTNISLKAFAKTIGEAYDDEIIDFDVYRKPLHPETWDDREKTEYYARKDVIILAKLIETYREVYGEYFDTSLSAGSMVWAEVVSTFDRDGKFSKEKFRKEIWELPLHVEQKIRPSFMGGITTPFWHNGVLLDRPKLKELYPWFKSPVIVGDDISSAYAASQIRELPLGRFRELTIRQLPYIKANLHNKNKIFFVNIRYSYTAAKFPLIPKMHMEEVEETYTIEANGSSLSYNEKSKYMETMILGNKGLAAVSTLDLSLAIEEDVYENLQYEFVPFLDGTYGIEFNMAKSEAINKVTQKYYHLKNTAPNKALRTAFKAPLVNIFGKTGERYYETDDTLNIFTREIIRKKLEEAKIPKYANVAVASVITSYTHHMLYFKGKEVGFRNMLYCDTDSMFYVTEAGPRPEEREDLGIWNNEIYNPARAIFLCPKKYVMEDDNKKVIKKASAGVDKDEPFTVDAIAIQRRVLFKNKVHKAIRNGIYLYKQETDISESYPTQIFYYKEFNQVIL